MRTLLLGFDSFDPTTFEALAGQGKLPNLSRYAEAGKYARFTVSDPPQTEVSWTSIASGADPGVHGVFDFVHRDPASYTPFVSLLPTRKSALGVQFVPPTSARTIFEEAVDMGYPATSLWWPATFPARPESPVRTIPGLGTPDLLGKLGVGNFFTTAEMSTGERKTPVTRLQPAGRERFTAQLQGPAAKKGEGVQAATVDLSLELDGAAGAKLTLGKQVIPLRLGQWSPIFEIPFKMGLLVTLKGLTQAILTQVEPDVRLYLLPLQIHPLNSPWRYATPPGFIKDVWNNAGPFLTLGWPQDTTGLEEACISDAQFLALCDSIFAQRERVLMHLLATFKEGVMGAIFDDLDRVQHMFFHNRPDVLEEMYVKLDGLVGRVAAALERPGMPLGRLIVLSDHGFSKWEHKVHLNQWLLENGYLKAPAANGRGSLDMVDWAHSGAYAVGLNSVYINQEKREGQGSIPAELASTLAEQIRARLLAWTGPDGRPVVQRALLNAEAFSGPLSAYGPDLVIGYTPGYRASPETGLGQWKHALLEPNHDHWGADHCIDSQAVPGVLFCSQGLQGLSQPSYRDIPQLAIGKALAQQGGKPPAPPTSGGEDKAILEERLKSLGYL